MLTLSDSFATMLSALAAECGLVLTSVDSADTLDLTAHAAIIVAAGGAEHALEPVLRRIEGGRVEVAAIGALADHHLAVRVARAGASAYFALPSDADPLRSWLLERADSYASQARRRAFAVLEQMKYRFDGILGDSPALRSALQCVSRVIPHGKATVLLQGETGTGKELVARAIHYNGPRREAPFVDVNCAAIPEQLLESELFGHEKGAFTDASVAKPGLFELAQGGTLFLDEIGHLPLPLQGKLLRVLEERTVRRVGGTKSVGIDVRIVAATHVDLAAAVARREFREDLYHRLNVVPVVLPPLRTRREDIPLLARHFLTRFAEEYGIEAPKLSPEGERALLQREWPGNLRELRNVMERTLLLATERTLGAGDFSEETRPPSSGGPLPFPATLAEITHAAAEAMLARCGGNKSETARRLGISRPRLIRILETSHTTGAPPIDAEEDERA